MGRGGWLERAVELGVVTNRLFVKGENRRKRLVWKVGMDG
jgi:hypothetical protein